MVGATCSRVTFFMNRFRKLGFIRYDGALQVHSALLNVVLHRWVRLHETAPCIARVDRTRWPPIPWAASIERRRSVAWFCLCPHSRQMAPTCLIGLSFDISFSRTPREAETTGHRHLLHE